MTEIIFNRDCDAFRYKILTEAGGKSATAETVLDVLFGQFNDDDSIYLVKYRHNPYIRTTAMQRINLFWVWPLMLITAPVRFILTGSAGVSTSGRLGLTLRKLIGHY